MTPVSSCSCLCPIHWNQGLNREWRCSWSSADRRCSNYIWVINNYIPYKGASYIRDLTVCVKELEYHRSRKWLVASSAPSHRLNQCCLTSQSIGPELLRMSISKSTLISKRFHCFRLAGALQFSDIDQLKSQHGLLITCSVKCGWNYLSNTL